MEYEDMTIGNDSYRVATITFQSYNAKGFGDYATRFTPDFVIDELNPKNEDNMIYIYRDYRTDGEYLYTAAINMITGKDPIPKTRSISGTMRG